MMRSTLMIAAMATAFVVGAPSSAHADEDEDAIVVKTTTLGATPVDESGRFGLGLQLGEPFAVTGKYWMGDITALQFAVGSYGGHFGPLVGADVVWQFARIYTSAHIGLGFYAGVGGALGFWDGCHRRFNGSYVCDEVATLAARFPLGGSMYFDDAVPLEVYMELSPVVSVLPGLYGAYAAGIGARYYF